MKNSLLAITSQQHLDSLQYDQLTTSNVKGTAPQVIANFIDVVFGLLGVIILVYFLYAGFKWMMAQDNKDEVKKSTEIMKNVAIGAFVIMIAYSLSRFVTDIVLNINR